MLPRCCRITKRIRGTKKRARLPPYRNSRQDRRPDKVAVLVTGNGDVTSVQDALGSLVDARLNQLKDPLFRLWRNHRPQVSVRKVTYSQHEN